MALSVFLSSSGELESSASIRVEGSNHEGGATMRGQPQGLPLLDKLAGGDVSYLEEGEVVRIAQGKGLRVAGVRFRNSPAVGKGKGVDAAAERFIGKGGVRCPLQLHRHTITPWGKHHARTSPRPSNLQTIPLPPRTRRTNNH
ncbi:hypothetical protein Barb6_00059 [Bacteroidales bacterium Barb6]|nr:hypothetical protein Barb6_00059 [Bacteroidales bacterium Barb6]